MVLRTPLCRRQLPAYSRGQDIANMVTHIVGGGIGVAVLVLSVLIAAMHRNVYGIVSGSIYGASMVALYTVSSVYHGLRAEYPKKVMQVIDHCTIYFLIAGTYTPILLSAIRLQAPALAWTMFGIEWGLLAFAVVFAAIDHKRYAALTMVCYIGMGWCIIFATRAAVSALSPAGFGWLLAGGIAYTIGAILYGIGSKQPVWHTVFHIFVDIGSILQAVCILFYVL